MIITREFIEKGAKSRVGITSTQFKLLGTGYPPMKGWKKAIIGKEISDKNADLYLRLKGVDSRKAGKIVSKERKYSRIEKAVKAPLEKPIREEIYEMIQNKPINFNGLVILNSFLEYLQTHDTLTNIQLDIFKKIPILYEDKNRQAVNDSFVYLAYSHYDKRGKIRVKIGYSKNPKQRVASMKTVDTGIELLSYAKGSKITEARLHQYFGGFRCKGEWFALQMTKNEVIDAFQKAVKEVVVDSTLKTYKQSLIEKWQIKPIYLDTNMKPI
jgi:hypothetical protein